jgi:UDP-N-acetylglucosamine transferase subunit ALG13
VIAQSCRTQEEFTNIETKEFLTPFEYSQVVKDASIIVGHAGMGTIITAHENHVPLIIMPRKFSLNEHRNDHQLATVKKFSATPGIHAATDEEEMHHLLDSRDMLTKCGEYISPERIDLIDFLKKSI